VSVPSELDRPTCPRPWPAAGGWPRRRTQPVRPVRTGQPAGRVLWTTGPLWTTPWSCPDVVRARPLAGEVGPAVPATQGGAGPSLTSAPPGWLRTPAPEAWRAAS